MSLESRLTRFTLFVFAAVAPVVAEELPLTPEQMSGAIQIESVSIPTPGEFFAAINKIDRPNWSQLARNSLVTNSTSRPQIALNLGTRVADGFIAVEAQDGQQVKNVGKDIIDLAKGIGVSQSILARGNSISDFAENNEWNSLKEELEATENEVKLQMAEQKDDELITLVSVGAWIRGTQAASIVISANYQPEAAQLLRQPDIVDYLVERLDALPERIKSDELVKSVQTGLNTLRGLIATEPGTPLTKETVEEVRRETTSLIEKICGPAANPA